jgi:putative tryptophan/tyrosine transport system substrate-binding protein
MLEERDYSPMEQKKLNPPINSLFLFERRKFVTLICWAAPMIVGWPVAGRAQRLGTEKRIAILMSNAEADPEGEARIAAFRQSLEKLGWTDGHNLRIETRWAAANIDRIHSFTTELIALAPDLIVGNSSPVVATLSQATRTIPIVFVLVNDPVDLGVVESLERPGRNVTGFTFMELPLVGKVLHLLKQAVPSMTTAALVFNPDATPSFAKHLSSLEAAPSNAVKLVGAPVRNIEELEPLLSGFGPGLGLIVPADSFNLANLRSIAQLVARRKLPAISVYRQFTVEGGLMSYGPDTIDVFRRSAAYVDRILKGARPADLPVLAPVNFNFAINLQAARSLDLDVPSDLLALANEVIE